MQGKEEDAQTTLLVVRHLVAPIFVGASAACLFFEDGKYQNKLPLPPVPKLLKAIPGFEGLVPQTPCRSCGSSVRALLRLCNYRKDSLDTKLRP